MSNKDLPSAKRRKLSVASISESEEVPPVSVNGEDEGDNEAYFSANFKSVCNTVLSDGSPEKHVFSDHEADIVQSFMYFPNGQQQLYVRLFLRKHQWIRVAKLKYDRIAEDLTPIVSGLVDSRFLCAEGELTDRREALNLLQMPELRSLCKDLKMPTSLLRSQKSEIVQSFFTHAQQHKPLFGTASFLDVVFKRVKTLLGCCVCVAAGPAEAFSKCLLLYSLTTSLASSWADDEDRGFSDIIYKLLQVKTGQLLFPAYEVYVTQPLFKSPEEFSRFYSATQNLQTLLTTMEAKDSESVSTLLSGVKEEFQQEIECVGVKASAPAFTDRMTTGWVLAKALSHGVEYLEKRGDYREASSLLQLLLSQTRFCGSYRGHWLDRLALNLDFHLGEKLKCLGVIKSAVEDCSLHPAKRLSLLQRAHKLCQAGSKSKPMCHRNAAKRKTKALPTSEKRQFSVSDFPLMDIKSAPEVVVEAKQYCTDNRVLYAVQSQDDPEAFSFVSVEGLAMYHYNTVEAWPCAVHAERSSFSLMFSLLMWDIIFCSDVPNVFRTKLQAGPLDRLTADFYRNRTEMIETHLQWIKSSSKEELAAAVGSCWEKNVGRVCFGADWDLLTGIEDVKSLAMCMGGELLSRVCRQFSQSYSQSCGGLPDLTLWNPSKATCKFVEVKGPGDRLSHKQIIWLSRLSMWGCQVEVCRVRESTTSSAAQPR